MAVYQRGSQFWIEYTYQKKRFREAIGPDRKLAEDVLGKRRVEIRENRFFPEKIRPAEPITFHDFCVVAYVPWAKANKRKTTFSQNLSELRRLDKEFGTKCLHEITFEMVERYQSRRKGEVGPASVNRELALLKHIFTKAMSITWESRNSFVTLLLKFCQERLLFLLKWLIFRATKYNNSLLLAPPWGKLGTPLAIISF
jgi:hypothetical protein